ncbi:polygalacturonase-like [Nicotiana tabacum]|uniref:Polygalacturonase-like n=1 Tax=Nicotiana tabacum TaxID=4097 RepID=A0A1S3X659_TOBAC|nr:polygalacturonase-like [Nicotiana tomentosiformis]XP_016435331.1 PREDICTED: polygalacturonase-like [Nicotiana tabacum]
MKMENPISSLFLISLLSIFLTEAIADVVTILNVLNLGAKTDGKTDSTKAFLTAWAAACGSSKPANIFVPQGKYLVKQAHFKGKCKNRAITFQIDGILVAPSDYNVIGNAKNWLLFEGVDGVSIHGGILDGQGTSLWSCKASGKNCPRGATTLGFSNSNNVAITELTSLNSQMFHIVFNGCKNVKLQAIKVFASGKSPNTDGIHVQLSSDISILNSKISTGDDCISIGSGTTNLWIQNIACGPGHGISIGSLGKDFQEAGVQNVTVRSVIFKNTQNGVRIKTWGRPSTGFVKNVLFQHATMINVQNPIVIDQNYCPYNKNCPGQVSGVKISDVTYQDIYGSSATRVAMKFDCSKRNPCQGIKLEDVHLTYKNQPAAQASCANAAGTTSGIIQPTSCL